MEVGGRCGGVRVGVGRLLTAHMVVHVGWGGANIFFYFQIGLFGIEVLCFVFYVCDECMQRPPSDLNARIGSPKPSGS